ncbi:MAG: 2-amino-4-hydroxy-6-hydroxymethyldihydropteridine diphosphokinase [Magnetococcus sp. WYHC-3]
MTHAPILIALGSNIAPLDNLARGLRLLNEICPVVALSHFYATDPVGVPGQAEFLNGAVEVRCDFTPHDLKQRLRAIETLRSRRRHGARHGPRTLDMDIALMGSCLVDEDSLMIPDRDIPQRAFLAIPLAQLAPNLVHPVLGVTLAELARAFLPTCPGMRSDSMADSFLHALFPGIRLPRSDWAWAMVKGDPNGERNACQ